MSLLVYVGFATFAVVWNVIVVCCFGCDRKLKPAIRLLLQALLLTDAVLMSFNIFNVVLVELAVVHPERIAGSQFQKVWLPYAANYALPGFYTAHMASVWMVIIVSVDRFLAVCRPKVAAKYMSSVWHTLGAAVGVWIGSILINLPRFFEYHVAFVGGSGDAVTNTTTTEVKFIPTRLAQDKTYNVLYNYCLYAITMLILPFIGLTVAHLKLASVARRRQGDAKSPANDAERTGRKCCCGSCIVSGPFTFVICVLFQVSPAAVIITKLVNEFSEVNLPALLGCSSIELTFNAVSRFFIYLMFSRYLYVDACKARVAAVPETASGSAVFLVDVGEMGDDDGGNDDMVKKNLMCSQRDDERNVAALAYLSMLTDEKNVEKQPKSAEPGSVNHAYDSAHD